MEVPTNEESNHHQGRVIRRLYSPIKCKWALAVAAVFLGFYIVLSIDFRGSNHKASIDFPKAMSAKGTHSVGQRERYILFRTALARKSLPLVFVNPYSPQTLALKWLAYQDQIIITPKDPITGVLVIESDMRKKLVQRYALMVFYYSTIGRAWRRVVPWEEHMNVDECSEDFEGVECDKLSGDVTKLHLVNRRVGGRIPQELGLLTELVRLDLSVNHLEGHIPHSVYTKLTNLELLSLSDNDIAFALRDDIGFMSNLKSLQLSNTYISGTLPPAMAKLTALNQLAISNSRLEGSFLHFFDHWRDLQILQAEKTQYLNGTIPTEIGHLTNLRVLALRRTQVAGSLPTEVGKLGQLHLLMLGGQFHGTLPSEMGQWTSMLRMVITDAPFIRGTLPSSLLGFSSMTSLAIEGTSIEGIIPSEFGTMTSLRKLNLENNLLTGSFPSELANLHALTKLQINTNNLSGTFPKEICDLPSVDVSLDCHTGLVCEDDCCPKSWCSWN